MIDLKSGFYNAIDNDRTYNAEDMNMPYSRIISNGVMAGEDFHVLANNNLTVTVKKGFGLFDKHWAELENDTVLTIPTPNVLNPRIDSVIVRNADRKCTIEYVQGEATETPAIPTLNDNEYRLATIYVSANAVSINQTNIEDTRPTGECGFITNLLWNSDITSLYDNWREQFLLWFDNLKTTLVNATAMVSLSSKYITQNQDETVIPIQIERFNSVTDILQVYINGLICIPEIDYTFNSFENIVLKNGVDAGTVISFIVYKSVDGSQSETVIDQVNELYERVEVLESKTDNALWVGADTMGANSTITPSKPLSQCKNGWLFCWCDYDETTGKSSDGQFVFTYVPKNIMKDISLNYVATYFTICTAINDNGSFTTCVKRISYNDTQIVGFVGNVATVDGRDVCLKAIYEF